MNKMLKLHNEGKIIITTSIYNIAELLDVELEINFFIDCMKKKMSGDEILNKKRRDQKYYKSIANINKKTIEKNISNFINDNEIEILKLPFEEKENEKLLYHLLYNYCLRSQDAFIASTAIHTKADYFLTNDDNLLNSIKNDITSYNLRDKGQRDLFNRTFLEAI